MLLIARLPLPERSGEIAISPPQLPTSELTLVRGGATVRPWWREPFVLRPERPAAQQHPEPLPASSGEIVARSGEIGSRSGEIGASSGEIRGDQRPLEAFMRLERLMAEHMPRRNADYYPGGLQHAGVTPQVGESARGGCWWLVMAPDGS